MIINPTNIKIIDYNKNNTFNSINSVIQFKPLVSVSLLSDYEYDRVYNHICTATKFYLGTQEDLENIINNKLNNNISTFKKVFFDKSCNYPRYKLNEKTNIKRCLDYNKANSVIISKLKFESIHFYNWTSELNTKDDDKIRVYYSPNEDIYYIIDRMCDSYYNSLAANISKFVRKFYSKFTIDTYIKTLFDYSILPSDATLVYTGYISILKTEKEYNTVNNIIYNYMQVTYDTELDKFVNLQCDNIDLDIIKSIDSMLRSTDSSTVDLALKLLCSYNIDNYKGTVLLMIYEHKSNIYKGNGYKSVAFSQLLESYDLSWSNIYYTILLHGIYDKLLKLSLTNDDINAIKEIVKNIIKQDFDDFCNSHISMLNVCKQKLNIQILDEK